MGGSRSGVQHDDIAGRRDRLGELIQGVCEGLDPLLEGEAVVEDLVVQTGVVPSLP